MIEHIEFNKVKSSLKRIQCEIQEGKTFLVFEQNEPTIIITSVNTYESEVAKELSKFIIEQESQSND